LKKIFKNFLGDYLFFIVLTICSHTETMQLPLYDKNKIWFLIARSLNGEAAPEDTEQLEKLLKK